MPLAQRKNRWTLAAGGVVLLLVGCAVALRRPAPGTPSVVLAPAHHVTAEAPTVGGPRFPHPKHADVGLSCTDCHEIGEDGKPGFPKVSFCLDCHADMEEDTPPEKRIENIFFTPDGTPKWIKAIQDYPPEIHFSHTKHQKLDCAACHKQLNQLPRLKKKLFTMPECVQCHLEKKGPTDCAVCHPAYQKTVRPASHHQGWELGHGQAVRAAEAEGRNTNCIYCHNNPNFCNECHQTHAPSSHLQGWELEHGKIVMAAGGPGEARCTFCHTTQAFCDDCHTHTKPSSHRLSWIQRHGTIWRAENVTQQTDCTFCHHQPAFCEDCHRDMKPRDHSTMFRTRTHGLVAAIDRNRCTYCHDSDFCVRCHESTAPRSHLGMWARGRVTHCLQCHFPFSANPECMACHKEAPTHSTAPGMPPGHTPALMCRNCHNAAGGGGAPPLRHIDNGMTCTFCHN